MRLGQRTKAHRARFRVHRAAIDISQLDVAVKVGMSEHRYWEIENGYRKASDEELAKIAKVFGCSPDALREQVAVA